MKIGTKGRYLFKTSGESFTLDAEVISIKGKELEIVFINPNGNYRHSRWLRTPQERARFSTDSSFEVKRRGAPDGNQNAAKGGPKRHLVTLSFREERLASITQYLQEQGKEMNSKHLRELSYEAIDAYLSRYVSNTFTNSEQS